MGMIKDVRTKIRKKYNALLDNQIILVKRAKSIVRRLIRIEAQTTRIENRTNANAKMLQTIRNEVQREFQRRDIWALRKAEVARLAAGRPIVVIKCPAPDSPHQVTWGDWYYCNMLKKNLEQAGMYAIVDCYEDWNCDSGADLVIVMRGRYIYRPDRRVQNCKYILWVVCHPDTVSDEEYELYDEVWLDSVSYAPILDARLNVPVRKRIVPVDTEWFQPAAESDSNMLEYDLVFVANSRGVHRNVTDWCEKNDIKVHVWGHDWERFHKDSENIILHGPVAYEDVPAIYAKSKVILNDHWADMPEKGFVNNRLLEVCACGKPLVSDGDAAFSEVFRDGIRYYTDEESFLRCVQDTLAHYEEITEESRAAVPAFVEQYSAARWAEEVKSMIENR